MKIPQKIKNKNNTWPSNSTHGYLHEENENINSKRYLHPHVHLSIIYNSQDKATWGLRNTNLQFCLSES